MGVSVSENKYVLTKIGGDIVIPMAIGNSDVKWPRERL